MIDDESKYEAALAVASVEVGLPTYCRPYVRSIVVAPVERWPRCCGNGCEPCNDVLKEVARRVIAKLSAT